MMNPIAFCKKTTDTSLAVKQHKNYLNEHYYFCINIFKLITNFLCSRDQISFSLTCKKFNSFLINTPYEELNAQNYSPTHNSRYNLKRRIEEKFTEILKGNLTTNLFLANIKPWYKINQNSIYTNIVFTDNNTGCLTYKKSKSIYKLINFDLADNSFTKINIPLDCIQDLLFSKCTSNIIATSYNKIYFFDYLTIHLEKYISIDGFIDNAEIKNTALFFSVKNVLKKMELITLEKFSISIADFQTMSNIVCIHGVKEASIVITGEDRSIKIWDESNLNLLQSYSLEDKDNFHIHQIKNYQNCMIISSATKNEILLWQYENSIGQGDPKKGRISIPHESGRIQKITMQHNVLFTVTASHIFAHNISNQKFVFEISTTGHTFDLLVSSSSLFQLKMNQIVKHDFHFNPDVIYS